LAVSSGALAKMFVQLASTWCAPVKLRSVVWQFGPEVLREALRHARGVVGVDRVTKLVE
jgi:uroporphyrinogen-III synthase